MNWILIAIMSGMIMTSAHDTEEACLGRKAILDKNKVITHSKCVEMQSNLLSNYNSSTTVCPVTGCR